MSCDSLLQYQPDLISAVQTQFHSCTDLNIDPTTAASTYATSLPAETAVEQNALCITSTLGGEFKIALSRYGWSNKIHEFNFELVADAEQTKSLWHACSRRAIIPVKGFKAQGLRFRFSEHLNKDANLTQFFWLAALRNRDNQFLILNKPASKLVARYIDREPLFLPSEFLVNYLSQANISFEQLSELSSYHTSLTL